MPSPAHGTIEVSRILPADCHRAFSAFADAAQRTKWGAPSDTAAFIVEQDEFREGGCDITRCGDASDPQILVESQYHHIAEPDLIILTETITDHGRNVAYILKTIALRQHGGACECVVTAQVTSLSGSEMIANTKRGHEGSLDHLVDYLGNSK